MARKGENIFKRKDGRWEARYIKGYESSGKAVYGYVFGSSYLEAKRKRLTASGGQHISRRCFSKLRLSRWRGKLLLFHMQESRLE